MIHRDDGLRLAGAGSNSVASWVSAEGILVWNCIYSVARLYLLMTGHFSFTVRRSPRGPMYIVQLCIGALNDSELPRRSAARYVSFFLSRAPPRVQQQTSLKAATQERNGLLYASQAFNYDPCPHCPAPISFPFFTVLYLSVLRSRTTLIDKKATRQPYFLFISFSPFFL